MEPRCPHDCNGVGECEPNGPNGSGVCHCDDTHGGSDCGTEICNTPQCVHGYCYADGKYSSEGAAREWSTVVDISIPLPSIKPVSLSSPRSYLSKTPKHVIF